MKRVIIRPSVSDSIKGESGQTSVFSHNHLQGEELGYASLMHVGMYPPSSLIAKRSAPNLKAGIMTGLQPVMVAFFPFTNDWPSSEHVIQFQPIKHKEKTIGTLGGDFLTGKGESQLLLSLHPFLHGALIHRDMLRAVAAILRP